MRACGIRAAFWRMGRILGKSASCRAAGTTLNARPVLACIISALRAALTIMVASTGSLTSLNSTHAHIASSYLGGGGTRPERRARNERFHLMGPAC